MNIKNVFLLGLLVIFIFISGCTTFNNSQQANNNLGNEEKAESIINLSFVPVTSEELGTSNPNEEWEKAKSINYLEIEGQKEVEIHLFIDTTHKSYEYADVHAFLEYNQQQYYIGMVGAYGLENIDIVLSDRTSNGIKEIEIVGGMGAAYIQMIMLSYIEVENKWVKLAEMGCPEVLDLDNDGNEELIVISRGSVPPYVQIYRWNYSQFEMTDVTKNTRYNYANLIYIEGKHFIEMGRVDKINAAKTYLYKYEKGDLILIGDNNLN